MHAVAVFSCCRLLGPGRFRGTASVAICDVVCFYHLSGVRRLRNEAVNLYDFDDNLESQADAPTFETRAVKGRRSVSLPATPCRGFTSPDLTFPCFSCLSSLVTLPHSRPNLQTCTKTRAAIKHQATRDRTLKDLRNRMTSPNHSSHGIDPTPRRAEIGGLALRWVSLTASSMICSPPSWRRVWIRGPPRMNGVNPAHSMICPSSPP